MKRNPRRLRRLELKDITKSKQIRNVPLQPRSQEILRSIMKGLNGQFFIEKKIVII